MASAQPARDMALGTGDKAGLSSRVVQPVDWCRHTMPPASLFRYLDIKVHHLVKDHDWRHIRVVGDYLRDRQIADCEKGGKRFNWQRPTATAAGDVLTIHCYPGRDYVYHYALILSTYLAMLDRFVDQVSYEPPSQLACAAPLREFRLDLRPYAAVVVGWGLDALVDGAWSHGYGYEYQVARVAGRTVIFIGFLHSIWGDIAGRVVHRFAELGARRVVYIGKVGGLDPDLEPNAVLATGYNSLIDDNPVRWQDFFEGSLARNARVRTGMHVTSASILLEDQDWLRRQRASFVDPEIGPMGAAAAASRIPFGYLHVVSNNLAKQYTADLSNERHTDVLQRRSELLELIGQLLFDRIAQLPV